MPLTIYAIAHTMAKGIAFIGPNTSIPINIGAISVFVALPNTAAYPSAAHTVTGKLKIAPRTIPRDEPIENNGVTSPPWNPIERVITVNNILSAKSKGNTVPPLNDADIRLVPNPQYLPLHINIRHTARGIDTTPILI